MKYTLGLLVAFLSITLLIGSCILGLIAYVVGLISFIFWTVPSGLDYESSMMILRVCLGIGSVVGIWFTFSKEGLEFPEDFSELISVKNE